IAKPSCGRPWNASMTRSANSPGTSSTTMSDPFISSLPCSPLVTRCLLAAVPSGSEAVGLGLQHADELVERLAERRHALVLEHPGDVVEVDPHVGQPGDGRAGLVDVGVDGAGHRA